MTAGNPAVEMKRPGMLTRFNPAPAIRLAGALGVLCVLGGGCTLNRAYPKTQITGYLGGHPFSFEAPKDYDVRGFDASVDTNGTIHVHVDQLTASITVSNLNAVANGQSEIINATAAAVNQAVQNGLDIAAKAAAAAAK